MTYPFTVVSRAVRLAAVLLAVGGTLGFSQPKAETPAGTQTAPEQTASTSSTSTQAGAGVLVTAVETGSPAEKAGIARGDTILEIDGTAVNDANALTKAIDAKKPGDAVSLKIRHGDAERTLSITLSDSKGRAHLGVTLYTAAKGRKADQRQNQMKGFRGRGFDGWFNAMPPYASGALIVKVVAGSPAEKAGLKQGELIVSVDGKTVDQKNTLSDLIAAHKVGDTVTLSVWSVDQSGAQSTREAKAALEKNPDKDAPYLGVEYSPGWRGFGHTVPVPGAMAGVLVAKVAENSPAAKAGIKEQDLITAVDGVLVQSPQTVTDAVARRKPGDSIVLTVYRWADGKTTDITVTLGENPSDKGKAWMGVSMSGLMGGFGGRGYMGAPGMPRFWSVQPRGAPVPSPAI